MTKNIIEIVGGLMSIYDDLRSIMELNGIDTSKYTDSMLDALILQAKGLINAPYTTDSQHNDFVKKYDGTQYMTESYPLKEVTKIRINHEPVTPLKVRSSGIIYFDKTLHGVLEVDYIVGLTEIDYKDYLLPICAHLANDVEGNNMASISEGDVSVSYDTGSSNAMIDSLVSNLRSKYGARVRFL